MLTLIKAAMKTGTIVVLALILGGFYWNGLPIATRISKLVGLPQGYEIVSDTKDDAVYYTKTFVGQIPTWFRSARARVATWLYPPVAGNPQPPVRVN
jgi:hypothetical protein